MKKQPRPLWLILIPLLVMALAKTNVHSPSTATISVDPPLTYKAEGESFTVDIKIVDVVNLYSWQVNMSYNPNVLEFVDVTEGDFLKSQPEGTYTPGPRTEEGWALFTWITVGAYMGVTGTGTLATVEFSVKGIGESVLNITSPMTKLIEMYFPPIPPGKTQVNEMPYITENGLFVNLVDPPTAEFTFAPSLPDVDEPISFDASASSATPPRAIVEYNWDFGDGTKKAYVKDVNLTSTATHAYTTGGAFNVTLTVVDNATATDLIQAIYGTATMPRVWYELYSTETKTVSLKFGHDAAVISVVPSRTTVTVGETVSINVTVQNRGVETETFSVKAYYGINNLIDTKQVTDLASEGVQSLIFEWSTANVATGDYQIWAEAILEGDTNTVNNKLIDGTVKVNPVGQTFPTELLIGAVGGVAILAVGVFLFMRRRSSQPSSPPS